MWYVIQTINGQDQQICTWINQKVKHSLFDQCFVPLYEDVWRREGTGHISIKKTFSGYVFIKTDQLEGIYEELRKIPNFTILLSDQRSRKEEKQKTFLSLNAEEEQFMSNIYTNGTMRVSYIEKNSGGKISRIIGPLAQYQDYIVKMDISHRRAVVEIPFLGQKRRMKFGLWCEKDEKIPWIEEQKRLYKNDVEEVCHVKENNATFITSLQPGDYVVNTMNTCGNQALKVIGIDERKRTVNVEMKLFGELIPVQMRVDDVEKMEMKKTDEGSTIS